MHRLEGYSFGTLQVDGEVHRSDLIICPDGTIKPNWWRKSGHHLVLEELHGLLETGVTHLVIGTGASGHMRVDKEVIAACRRRGIEIVAIPTAKAVDQYNRLTGQNARVLACFHLSC